MQEVLKWGWEKGAGTRRRLSRAGLARRGRRWGRDRAAGRSRGMVGSRGGGRSETLRFLGAGGLVPG